MKLNVEIDVGLRRGVCKCRATCPLLKKFELLLRESKSGLMGYAHLTEDTQLHDKSVQMF